MCFMSRTQLELTNLLFGMLVHELRKPDNEHKILQQGQEPRPYHFLALRLLCPSYFSPEQRLSCGQVRGYLPSCLSSFWRKGAGGTGFVYCKGCTLSDLLVAERSGPTHHGGQIYREYLRDLSSQTRAGSCSSQAV